MSEIKKINHNGNKVAEKFSYFEGNHGDWHLYSVSDEEGFKKWLKEYFLELQKMYAISAVRSLPVSESIDSKLYKELFHNHKDCQVLEFICKNGDTCFEDSHTYQFWDKVYMPEYFN